MSMDAQWLMISSDEVKVKDTLFPIMPEGAIPCEGCASTICLMAGMVDTINAGVSLV